MLAMTRRTWIGSMLALGGLGGRALAATGQKPGAAALSKVPEAARTAVDSGDIPGALSLIWLRGELLQLNIVGLRDPQQKLPLERDTIFAVASMSKPITVATALSLVDAGMIKLSDPITKWAPEFANMRVLTKPNGPLENTYPAPRAITIEDLMTHRSGLTYPYLAPGPLGGALMQKMGFGIESTLTPDKWMKELATLPLLYAPGERFNYGHSIDVLGFISARVGGKTLAEVMREHLFAPLGMKDTGFWVPPEKRARRAATVYSPEPGNFMPGGVPSFTADKPPAYTSGGQGLLTTADDYLRFARMLLGGGKLNGTRVLKEKSVALMTSNHITAEQRNFPSPGIINWKSQGFGYGVMIIEDPKAYAAAGQGAGSAGTYGWGGAFGGWWQNDPKQEITVIWLQECLPPPPAPGAFASGAPRIPGVSSMLATVRAAYAAIGS